MDRIKRLSYEVLDNHKSKFGEDFADNKKTLDQITIIRSKGLKNEVAGYITKFIKKEIEYFKPMLQRQKEATEEAREAWRQETVAQRLDGFSLQPYPLCKVTVSQGLLKG